MNHTSFLFLCFEKHYIAHDHAEHSHVMYLSILLVPLGKKCLPNK